MNREENKVVSGLNQYFFTTEHTFVIIVINGQRESIMTLLTAKSDKLIYHLTELDNLESIVQNKLLPRIKMLEAKLPFIDVANREIISKREELGLNGYTPFHFHPYSAFDKSVQGTHPDRTFIYLCLQRTFAESNGFKIITTHPRHLDAENFRLYDYAEGFNHIDWERIKISGNEDNEVKQAKMAECLTDMPLSIQDFIQIAVKDSGVEQQVGDILKDNAIIKTPPHINIHPEWFG